MDVILGIAAKSMEAAYQLANLIHGHRTWAWQQTLGLQPRDTCSSPAPEAAARLLLSHDTRTAYLLVATHAPAEDWLRAATAAASHQHPSPLTHSSSSEAEDALEYDRDTTSTATPTSIASAVVDVAAPPLLRFQQLHDTAVNVQLLQLFLACDAVLVVLPTGQGLGLAAGGCGAPLSSATDWITRLRLLQGAKRALNLSLASGGGRGGPKIGEDTSPAALTRRSGRAPASVAAVAAIPATGKRDEVDCGKGGGEAGPLAQLRCWSERTRPPTLFFVSPGALEPQATPAPSQAPSATGNAATAPHRSGSAQNRTASSASTDPRDANSLLRGLLKRCRPVALSTADSTQLCMFDSEALLVETGPLVLDPAIVQAAVLAALLGPEEGDPDLENPIVAVPRIVGAAARRCGKGLQHLTDSLGKALAAAADERRVVSSMAEAAAASGTSSGGGGTLGAGDDGGLTAARRFCGTWQAGARHLYDAAVVACREAAVQPLDWVPPGIEAVLMAGFLRPGHAAPGNAAPGHAASTAHSRSRSRAHTTATAATAATPRPADSNPGSGSPAGLAAAAAWLAGAGTGGGGALSSRLATAICREVAQGALQQYTAAAPPRYPKRVHYAASAAMVAALRAKAPPGPAASAASAWLQAACEDEWRRVAGRQQCSALSATGRPCTRPLHGPSEPHCAEGTSWVVATTTGCSLVDLPDPFDLQVANMFSIQEDDAKGVAVAAANPLPATTITAAAPTPPASAATTGRGRTKGPKRGGGAASIEPSPGGASGPAAPLASPSQAPLAHSRHMMVAIARAADGTTRQCTLGPWVTVTRLGPASLYSDRRGLTNQPGLNGNFLYPLTMQWEAESGTTGPRLGALGRGGTGVKGGKPRPRGTLSGPETLEAGGGSEGEVSVVLDEQSFPSLAEAAAAQGGRQGVSGATMTGPTGHRRGSKQPRAGAHGNASDTTDSTIREREKLARFWPYPPEGSPFGSRPESNTGGGNVSPRGAVRPPMNGGDAGGSSTSKSRRGRGGLAAAKGGGDVAAFPPLSNAKDVRKLYVSYEYQTLDGRRFLVTPQQLMVAAAAATSGVSESHTAPGGPIAGGLAAAAKQPGSRKGLQRPPSSTPGATPMDPAAAAAAIAAVGGSVGNSGAASFLLQHDAPMYMQPPPGLQPDPAALTVACDGAAAWDPTPRRPGSLAQLRRIFVVTPPSASGEPLLAMRPTVQFRIREPPQLPWDTAAAAGLLQWADEAKGGAVQSDKDQVKGGSGLQQGRRGEVHKITAEGQQEPQLVSGQGPAAAVVQVSMLRPLPLPSDSYLIISLPFLYGFPMEWLGWGLGLSGRDADGDVGGTDKSYCTSSNGGKNGEETIPSNTSATPSGGGAERNTGVGGASFAHEDTTAGLLVSLVQLDDRTPFEAKLLAGSALFPLGVS